MVLAILFTVHCSLFVSPAGAQTALTLFDEATFYDGYLFSRNPDSLVQDGILRHSTSLYAVRLTDEQIAQIGDSLQMKVNVRACCDNYDRIGNINLAFVPKGQAAYLPDSVQRIELGRFITPFMNKNKLPDVVPYDYDISYVSHILRDASILRQNDIWVEFELFGVPYAANTQVAGCAGRSDVFKGTLVFETTTPALPRTERNVLVPIVMKKNEARGHNLNNYSEAGTDTIGLTTKTYTFDVPCDVADGQLVIVTSNHGANSGGEEYNRRWHYIYLDDALVLTYKPGRTSCEPFRKYNTQSNGIYGLIKRSDAAWQSFSNWCPGDVIDNRIVGVGAFKAGRHKVRISVPEAVFQDKQGDIPVSIFFQGLTEGQLVPAAISSPVVGSSGVSIGIVDGQLSAAARDEVLNIDVYDLQGKHLLHSSSPTLSLQRLPHSLYLVHVELASGLVETHKVKY
ncbi:MAG: hypothetical protein IJ841_09230 [Prevotella sp.]|nr:hypothetical protein [Prevotella sp.]